MGRSNWPISMRIESRSLNRLLRSGDKPARQAAVDAINLGARPESAKAIRKSAQDLSIPQKFIRKRTYISKARMRRPSYVIRTTTWPLNIAELGAQPKFRGGKGKRRGVGLTTGKRMGGIKAPHAFLGTSPSTGKLRAYERVGTARTPIRYASLQMHAPIAKRLKQMNRRAMNSAMRKHYPKQLKFRSSALGKSRSGGRGLGGFAGFNAFLNRLGSGA